MAKNKENDPKNNQKNKTFWDPKLWCPTEQK